MKADTDDAKESRRVNAEKRRVGIEARLCADRRLLVGSMSTRASWREGVENARRVRCKTKASGDS